MMDERSQYIALAARHSLLALESVSDAVITTSLRREITYVNRAAEQLTGVGRARAIGRRCCDLLHCEAEGQESLCPFETVLRTGCVIERWPTVLRSRDNERANAYVSLCALRSAAGSIVGGLHTVQLRAAEPLPASAPLGSPPPGSDDGLTVLERAERCAIEDTLRRHQWNRTTAAQELGMSRTTLWRHMHRLGVPARPTAC